MKKIITVFVFCFLFSDCFSQAGEWVWIKGPNISSVPANFGVQGVPSPTNNPPSVYEACEWTDLNGNFWLFGGYHGGTFNDLWKYDPVLNEWTWMKGPGIMGNFGNYGTLGIPSPANNPPSRGYGAATWTDSLGNLWLFGGSSSIGPASDLWKYDVLTNEWTWMKGPNIGNQPNIFGTQGVADPGNNPGARWECVGTWTDNNSDLWLYSGFTGFGGNNFDDLWKYNIGSNQWTWMKGSQTQFQPAVYGTLGIEDSLNTPGSRAVYSRWKDANGNLWLFGGMIMALEINDLWRYKPITNNWTWMGGSTITGATGIYNTKCIASPASIPGARMENRACWTDHNDNFWFFGGGRGGNLTDAWNDVWMYCVATNEWIWQSGDSISNSPGNWGTLGVSSPSNKPNGRAGAVGWTMDNNHLYLFGGSTTGFNTPYNDLWKYTIDTTCGVCPAPNSIEENNPPGADELFVFPNPANSSLTILFPSTEKQTVELRIYNTLGKQVYSSKEEITKGKFEKEINVENLSSGIYFLQLKMKNGMMSRKVLVER